VAIPGTGSISFSQIQAEFGGSNPISLSEYYAGGLYTPTGASGTNGAVPGSSSFAMSKFYGTQKLIINTNARVIFGYGFANQLSSVSMTNLVSNAGVVAGDVTGVGTLRYILAAAGYGGDKAIFGYGYSSNQFAVIVSVTNRVNNTGGVAGDTAGVGTIRYSLAAAGYGGDRAVFGYGFGGQPNGGTMLSVTNRVNNTGGVAGDTAGVGTARSNLAAATFGGNRAIFGYGSTAAGAWVSVTNLVSNTGDVASNATGVGTARGGLAAATYGGDKVIFGYGSTFSTTYFSITNLVNNQGAVVSEIAGVGTTRTGVAAASYGGDKAVFGYGSKISGITTYYNITNRVNNLGAVVSEIAGVGTARSGLAAATFG
jgi:hypothetical protein